MVGDALVRPGRVVVRLVLGQDGAQMPFAEHQHAVEDLAAQGADEPLAGRVHARSLDGGAQVPGSGPSLPRSRLSWHAHYAASAVAHAAGNAMGRGDNRKEGHRGRVMPAWRQLW
jgi:hypothetical protein